jgi:hypothetical protein
VRLGDVLGHGQKVRHRPEGAARVVLVESGDDDAHAAVGQLVDDGDEVGVEELPFVDADHLGRRLDERAYLGGRPHGPRLVAHLGVGDDVVARVALVDLRLEDLHPLARDLGPAQAPDQLLALAREHGAGDDLDPAGVRVEPREVLVLALCGEIIHLTFVLSP